MSKIHNVSKDSLIIEQENDTWFINKKDGGIEIKGQFLTVDGYETGFILEFDKEETKVLGNFLNKM